MISFVHKSFESETIFFLQKRPEIVQPIIYALNQEHIVSGQKFQSFKNALDRILKDMTDHPNAGSLQKYSLQKKYSGNLDTHH